MAAHTAGPQQCRVLRAFVLKNLVHIAQHPVDGPGAVAGTSQQWRLRRLRGCGCRGGCQVRHTLTVFRGAGFDGGGAEGSARQSEGWYDTRQGRCNRTDLGSGRFEDDKFTTARMPDALGMNRARAPASTLLPHATAATSTSMFRTSHKSSHTRTPLTDRKLSTWRAHDAPAHAAVDAPAALLQPAPPTSPTAPCGSTTPGCGTLRCR